MIKAAYVVFVLLVSGCCWSLGAEEEVSFLFRDLSLVDEINQKSSDRLPYHYNYGLMGGYWNMPSARMTTPGMAAAGFSYLPPYRTYALTLQVLDRIEFTGSYKVYVGQPDPAMGSMGFGDFADRGASVKCAVIKCDDGFPRFIPEVSVGFEDFLGTKRFHAFYTAATYSVSDLDLEVTAGWGRGRIKGFFGALGWTPFRRLPLPLLSKLTLLAEWDAIDYQHWGAEHAQGRSVKSRINVGLSLSLFDVLQLNISTLRGKEIAASASVHYNLGESKGLFPKVKDPPLYSSPVDIEPLGVGREEKELAQELVGAFFKQGLNLYRIDLKEGSRREIWLKVINVRYREEPVLKERIQKILAALVPSNIDATVVIVEVDGIPSHSYYFRTLDLRRWQGDQVGDVEMDVLAPMRTPLPFPTMYDATPLYQRRKKVGAVTVRPRVVTFFGSSTGKFKYSFGALVGIEGYLWDQAYYHVQTAYHIASSTSDVGDRDLLNPSQLLNVRSDSVCYFQRQTVALEEGYLQQGAYLGKGWYGRLACGYFEPAYGGIAAELVYYPPRQDWSIGVEVAGVLKRRYRGLGFTTRVRQFVGEEAKEVHFIGYQYFLDLAYDFKPLQLEFKVSVGKFLARDAGVHFEVGRYYPSGFRFSVWYDWTSAHDQVNGGRYRNKGIAFFIPLDFFLKKSSRSMIGEVISAWLRDTGARAATGKRLQPTLQQERMRLRTAS